MNERRSILDEVIELELENLSRLDPKSDEYVSHLEALIKLYNLKMSEEKHMTELAEKTEDRRVQKEENSKDRKIKIGITISELLVPLIFYGRWMKKGFDFEKDGTFTSTTFRGLFSRFIPTKIN